MDEILECWQANLLLVSPWRWGAVWGAVPLHVFFYGRFGMGLGGVHVTKGWPWCWNNLHAALSWRLPKIRESPIHSFITYSESIFSFFFDISRFVVVFCPTTRGHSSSIQFISRDTRAGG